MLLYKTLYSFWQLGTFRGVRLQFPEGEEENYQKIHCFSHFVLEL